MLTIVSINLLYFLYKEHIVVMTIVIVQTLRSVAIQILEQLVNMFLFAYCVQICFRKKFEIQHNNIHVTR